MVAVATEGRDVERCFLAGKAWRGFSLSWPSVMASGRSGESRHQDKQR